MSRYLFKLRRFLLHHILHADDTPHKVALGAAIATVVAFSPTVGFQTAIAIGIAAMFRANKAICVPIVWITNPFTWLPIYGGCLALGRVVLSAPVSATDVHILSRLEQGPAARDMLDLAFWQNLLVQLAGYGFELWVGCLIVGVIAAVAAYFLCRWGVDRYRERRRRKILLREMFRSKPKRLRALSADRPA